MGVFTKTQPAVLPAFHWDPKAKQYSAEAHDKPAPTLLAPCVTFGFSVRPYEAQDPISQEDNDSQHACRQRWVEQVNWILALFEDPEFRHENAVSTESFAVRINDDKSSRYAAASKNFRIRWRGLAGYVVVEQEEEYTSFLFTLSLSERDAPRGRKTADGAELPLPSFAEEAGPHAAHRAQVRDAFAALSQTDREVNNAFDVDDLTDRTVAALIEPQTKFLLDDLWEAFVSDLQGASERRVAANDWKPGQNDNPIAPPTIAQKDLAASQRSLFPGEIFAATKGVVVREDTAWADSSDPWTPADSYDLPTASARLSERRGVLRAFFPEGRNREFVGSLTMGAQAIFASTLGSTHYNSALEKSGVSTAAEQEADVKPTRYFVLFKNRPDAPQLGRLVERLHALETLRLAAMLDIDDLRNVGAELRHLSVGLDKLQLEFAQSINVSSRKEVAKMEAILTELTRQGVPDKGQDSSGVRGGLSYRLSQSSLYAKAYERRLEEMREQWVEGWQTYQEFVKRRLKETFDSVSEIDERREFMFTRIQVMAQSHAGSELVEVQRSADLLSTAAFLIAIVTLGAQAGTAVFAALPDLAQDYIRDLYPSDPLGQHQFAGVMTAVTLVSVYLLIKAVRWILRVMRRAARRDAAG